ncbi:GDP-Man:Man(3)GlcNAc(2)-PP-Dol alpha-1,2-mannosyltransferase-like [Watersipora subatra]|uniref:GDP-Man:Man(3)GlcNAc(2)-PP-Dol alpha-1,2-mannosyltransferase-like n=1 Tax=Watersipora subatra TaxID=2589382 RepID=UPI00355C3156
MLTGLVSDVAGKALLIITLALPPLLFSLWMLLRAVRDYRKKMCRRKGRITIGFFHPYCNAGGGGERVLWCAIRALQIKYPQVDCIVYTGDIDATDEEILSRASDRLGVEPIREVEFIYLNTRHWVEAKRYPVLTLLGQSLGSLVLGWNALRKFIPDIYIDSMGYAFTLPLFKYLGGCQVAAYVHYPTISTDMLQKVERRESSYNNQSAVARSSTLSRLKLLYYKLFAFCYGRAGRSCDVVMVNSSWTMGHIADIWSCSTAHIVYPPCDVTEFMKLPLSENKLKQIISVAQFRPEKDHKLQIRAFHKYMSGLHSTQSRGLKLVLVGGCRNEEDRQRVEELRRLAEELEVSESVEFCLNVPFSVLKEKMAESTVGIHTMWNEHFGIGVVELMAGGTIVLAHKSGGPLMDIVTTVPEEDRTGYLANDIESYSECLEEIFRLSIVEREEICKRARYSALRFDEEMFDKSFLSACAPLVQSILVRK